MTRPDATPENLAPACDPDDAEAVRRAWDLRGGWLSAHDGERPVLRCRPRGDRAHRALAREGRGFGVEVGEALRIEALVRCDAEFDGTLRLGVWAEDAQGECVQRRALKLAAGSGLAADTWTPVQGGLRLVKPGAVRARAWLLVEQGAQAGQIEVAGLRLSRDTPPAVAQGNAVVASASAPVPPCDVCGSPLQGLDAQHEACPACGARARTRTLAGVLRDHVLPRLPPTEGWPGGRATFPLLGFAVTPTERRLLAPHFTAVKSASLYLAYEGDHEVGIDARALPYADGAFSGVMACCVYDYFTEQDQAFAEAFRVLQPGGVMFVQYMAGRLLDGDEAPVVHNYLPPERRTFGFMAEVPADTEIPSIRVGRRWLVAAMHRAGFEAERVAVADPATGLQCDWFIGRKPAGAFQHFIAGDSAATQRGAVYRFALAPGFGARQLTLTLDVPEVPPALRQARFAEHVRDASGQATAQIILARPGGVAVSHDLGRSWSMPHTPEIGQAHVVNCFTTASGVHLVQARGGFDPREPLPEGADPGALFRYAPDWTFIDTVRPTDAHWHGTRSIDEAGGTLMFGDYQGNRAKYEPAFAEDPRASLPHLKSNRIWRSRDDGAHWAPVMEAPAFDVRHLHTVAADPHAPGTWWASSGDGFHETHVWRSDDDGEHWRVVSDLNLPAVMPDSFASDPRSRFRFTDLVVGPDFLLWGTDDLMGNDAELDPALPPERRAGARLILAPKHDLARSEVLAVCGNLFRSVVDVGPAWLFLTQAKNVHGLPLTPSLVLVSKRDPHVVQHLADLPNLRSTCFSCSLASRATHDGVFFSHRHPGDLFDARPGLLRWQLKFD